MSGGGWRASVRCGGVPAALLVLLAAGQAGAGAAGAPETDVVLGEAIDAEPEWSVSASAMAYWVPDSEPYPYVQPTVSIDRDRLHLELRYNYEDMETGSAWIGANLGVGDASSVALAVTPMLGVVFGATDGFAPGVELMLTWRSLGFYSEGEWVIATDDDSESFLYNWSELTVSPTEWPRLGLVGQRTRAYETDLEIQRGVLAGLTVKGLDLAAYVFNLGWEDPTVVVSVGLGE